MPDVYYIHTVNHIRIQKQNVCCLMLRNFDYTKTQLLLLYVQGFFIYSFSFNTLHANMYSCVNMKAKLYVQYKETKKQSGSNGQGVKFYRLSRNRLVVLSLFYTHTHTHLQIAISHSD
jgi:hypothetical protein